mmetsp:Transcript_104992/g.203291  ORF Transcript_104992/g.203291 Transcript_104992/m.203291 type:complete len:288 (-) Transcript_104992:335-1198(-)
MFAARISKLRSCEDTVPSPLSAISLMKRSTCANSSAEKDSRASRNAAISRSTSSINPRSKSSILHICCRSARPCVKLARFSCLSWRSASRRERACSIRVSYLVFSTTSSSKFWRPSTISSATVEPRACPGPGSSASASTAAVAGPSSVSLSRLCSPGLRLRLFFTLPFLLVESGDDPGDPVNTSAGGAPLAFSRPGEATMPKSPPIGGLGGRVGRLLESVSTPSAIASKSNSLLDGARDLLVCPTCPLLLLLELFGTASPPAPVKSGGADGISATLLSSILAPGACV